MLLVGYGALGRAIGAVLQEQHPLYVYTRNKQSVNGRARYVSPEQFDQFTHVCLALPAQAYGSFFTEHGHRFNEQTTFYVTATSILFEHAKKITGMSRVVPCKFAGHANIMAQEKEGLFVIPRAFQKEKDYFQSWIGDNVDVIYGDEEDVLKANQMATLDTLLMMKSLEEKLQAEVSSHHVREAVLKQIIRGVAHAYVNDELGPFSKQLLEQSKREAKET